MKPQKHVGILGGSFDPVHFGHINLAINLMETCALEEVLFVPTRLSPFKEHSPPSAPAKMRLELLKLALAPLKNFRIIDWEVEGKGPAYTIDTVRKLAQDASAQLHLLLGEDHCQTLLQWKDAEELMRLAPPIIGARAIQKIRLPGAVEIPLFDISSTMIRKRLAEKKYCGHLVPANVLEFIYQNKMYA
jgi:nicotinate-nucleotide adenylyltransferase